MPELPDIAAYITALEPRIVGEPIEHVRLASPFLLRTVAPPIAAVEGRRVRELRRIGKRIVIGLEDDLEEYVQKLCAVFAEGMRVLKSDGTCWVNLGDTYAGSGKGYGSQAHGKLGRYAHLFLPPPAKAPLPDKSLCMVPFRFALDMGNLGWRLRNTVIWHKSVV